MNKNPFTELAKIMSGAPDSNVLSKVFQLGAVSDTDPIAISTNEILLSVADLLQFDHDEPLNLGDIVLLSPFYESTKAIVPSKFIVWGVIS